MNIENKEISEPDNTNQYENMLDDSKHILEYMILDKIKDFPVWIKFNIVSRTIENTDEDKINWANVNLMLKTDDPYDFNAFDYIDSKEKFSYAHEYSNVSGIIRFNNPYVRRVCKDCGNTYTLTVGQVQFYRKHEYQLPKRCNICLGKGKKSVHFKQVALQPTIKEIPLNSFAEALKISAIKLEEEK